MTKIYTKLRTRGGIEMKKEMIFCLLGAFILIPSYLWAGFLGAPEPLARSVNVSLGVGYSYLSEKVEFDANKYTFIQNQIYAQFNAAYKNAEGYIRLGGADSRFEELFVTTMPGHTLTGFESNFKDSSLRAFLTLGAKYKFDISHYISLGPIIQASFFDDYEDKTSGYIDGVETTQKVKIKNPFKVQAAALLQINLRPVHIYAGPFIYWFRGDVESTAIPGLANKMKETGNFGAVGGVRISIYPGVNLELEAQYNEKFSFGGLISYSF